MMQSVISMTGKSRIARAWAAQPPRIQLLFQSTYPPRVKVIERLWKAMHDTIIRNHRYTALDELMRRVRRLLEVAQPLPGNLSVLAIA